MKNKVTRKIISCILVLGLFFEATPVWALTKDETIYAKANSNGSLNKVIVSEHVSNNGSKTIKDKTRLNNITNVNGNETFNKDGNSIVWEANGNDIYYQGETNDKLPISLDVKYYLNNEEYDVKDMIGKKGIVKIVINYTNNEKHTVLVNGKNEVLYTPFVVATTSIVNNTNNKNISITNGKVIDNGTNSILVSLAAPGLYDSLKLNSLNGLDSTVIEYSTDSFELSTIYSVASSKLLEDDDLDIFDDINELYSSINELVNASNQLVNGSEELLNGANKLKNGTNTLKNGINSAYKGSTTIRNSVKSSVDNMSKDKSSALDEGTINAIANNAKNNAGLSNEEQAKIGNKAVLAVKSSDTYKELNNKYNEYVSGAKQASDAISQYQAAYEQYKAAGDEETAQAMLDKVEEYKGLAEQAKQAATTYKSMMTLMEETAKSTAISTANETSKEVAFEVAKKVAPAVANQVKNAATTKTIASLNTLITGLDSLSAGLDQLNEGAETLYDGTASLTSGIDKLSKGLEKFDNDGIKKISNFVNGDVKDIQGKVEALVNLSNAYNTLDDIDDTANGSSKIIYIIDSVKKEKQKYDKVAVVEKKSLWQKIKGLFK